jgi:hypothetical protein
LRQRWAIHTACTGTYEHQQENGKGKHHEHLDAEERIILRCMLKRYEFLDEDCILWLNM